MEALEGAKEFEWESRFFQAYPRLHLQPRRFFWLRCSWNGGGLEGAGGTKVGGEQDILRRRIQMG